MRLAGMRMWLCLILLLTFGAVSAVPAQEAVVSSGVPWGNAYIPKGTTMDVELITKVSSGDQDVNSTAYFRLLGSVMVNGVTVLPAGSVGTAVVTSVEQGSFFGKKGKIAIAARYVVALNGAQIPLDFTIKKEGEIMAKDTPYEILSVYTMGATKLWLLYPALRGGEAEIPVGTRFQVTVPDDADLGCVPEQLEVVMVKKAR